MFDFSNKSTRKSTTVRPKPPVSKSIHETEVLETTSSKISRAPVKKTQNLMAKDLERKVSRKSIVTVPQPFNFQRQTTKAPSTSSISGQNSTAARNTQLNGDHPKCTVPKPFNLSSALKKSANTLSSTTGSLSELQNAEKHSKSSRTLSTTQTLQNQKNFIMGKQSSILAPRRKTLAQESTAVIIRIFSLPCSHYCVGFRNSKLSLSSVEILQQLRRVRSR
jgi:hypothetical protein